MLTRIRCGLAAALWVGLCGGAIAQQCSHAVGEPWVDWFNFTWHLNQSSAGYVWGTVDTNCDTWVVAGSMDEGNLYVTATNPNPWWFDPYTQEYYTCGQWFTYSGNIHMGGCNTGNGTWTNPQTSGAWRWGKACDVPSGETVLESESFWWNGDEVNPADGPQRVFQMSIHPEGGPNLSGRLVRETSPYLGTDYCYFEGSARPQFNQVTAPEPFWIGADNKYGDIMGWGQASIDYYRGLGIAPCYSLVYQQMQIGCATPAPLSWTPVFSWAVYKDHEVYNLMGVSTVGIKWGWGPCRADMVSVDLRRDCD